MLVLDEPTNHLDLEAIDALVEGLKKYDGTLLFVSHDRWFVPQLATRILEITPAGLRDFPGTYDEYLERWATTTSTPTPRYCAPSARRRPPRRPRAAAPRTPSA